MKTTKPYGLTAAGIALLWSTTAGATYIQVADSGHVVSYTYAQFLNGTGGLVIGQANGYGDDAGFFYDSTQDRYIQVADTGHVVSYTYAQFLNGTGGLVIGQANGYGDDAGFFYDPTQGRYIQVADSGHVVSYTYAQFLNGTGGLVIGQANGYGDDAGFFFVPDPTNVTVPEPMSIALVGFGFAVFAVLRLLGMTQSPESRNRSRQCLTVASLPNLASKPSTLVSAIARMLAEETNQIIGAIETLRAKRGVLSAH